ncbi:MAG: energy transducer TonB [Deltaproteobacteria bacterium]|nr:energy transducer TonB [Deltaproteobacteria bacterium]
MTKINTAGLYIPSKYFSIIISLAIHCIILSLLFTASAVPTIPSMDIINIHFVHDITEPKAEPASVKAPQKAKVAPIQKISRKKITSKATKQKNNIQNIIEQQAPLAAKTQTIAGEEKKPIPNPDTINVPEIPSAILTEYKQSIAPVCFSTEPASPASGSGGSITGQHNGNPVIFETRIGSAGAPAFVHREIPAYPRTAQRLGKEGKVVLRLLIDAGGNLKNIEIVESSWLGFTEAAVDAVRRSTFSPGYRNGECVISKAILAVHFKLN